MRQRSRCASPPHAGHHSPAVAPAVSTRNRDRGYRSHLMAHTVLASRPFAEYAVPSGQLDGWARPSSPQCSASCPLSIGASAASAPTRARRTVAAAGDRRTATLPLLSMALATFTTADSRRHPVAIGDDAGTRWGHG